ncbi:MAG: sulfatase-like hydrolase/transferase [Planctomycetes bacterium]|nr:sulfatase-like hydrolase/transferase [Planctomycetota bacterium]
MHSARTLRFALALLAACCGCGGGRDASHAAHAILITCDTLRADRLGLYGYERATSPELEAFAREAWTFDDAYSCAPWTQPAISSLLTGRAPEEIGVTPGNTRRMHPRVETLAERLHAQGFATAACVSNGLLRRMPDKPAGVAQGFDHFDDRMTAQEKNRVAYERDATATTNAALEWLDARPRDQRFFLWVHYQDPHGPYLPPQRIAAEFDRPPKSDEHLPIGTTQRGLHQIPQYQQLDGETRPDVYRDRYDAEVKYFDSEFGRLMKELRSRGLLDEAIVVFTADHGESLGEHDQFFCHGENVQREEVHVPLVVRPPHGIPTDAPRDARGFARNEAPVNHLDVVPTLLAALDLGAVAGLRGLRLDAPLALPRERTLVQSFIARREGKDVSEWAITDANWRLLWHANQTPRLYDARTDPREEHDVAAAHPEVVARLGAAFGEYQRSLHVVADGVEVEPDAETSKGLEALGYAESKGD